MDDILRHPSPFGILLDCSPSAVSICVSACLSAGWDLRGAVPNHPWPVFPTLAGLENAMFFNVSPSLWFWFPLLLQGDITRGRLKAKVMWFSVDVKLSRVEAWIIHPENPFGSSLFIN